MIVHFSPVPMPHYDLHCHSTHSDGLLTPAAVVARAAARGVDVLALTDHDEVSGLAEAQAAAADAGIELVCGAELSVSWEDITLHVVALGIDPANRDADRRARRRSASAASTRARRIGDALAAAGIARRLRRRDEVRHQRAARSRGRISRASWSKPGYASEMKDVFKRYLRAGKPGYVAARVGDAAAGGRLDPRRRRPGGARASGPLQGRPAAACAGCSPSFAMPAATAIEVLSPSHTPAQYAEFADLRARVRLARVLRLRLPRSRRKLDRSRRPARHAGRRGARLEGW